MTIKRILLLLSAMATFVVFAAPVAQASNQFWTSGGEKIGGEEEAVEVEGTGFLSSSTGGLTTGPCTVHTRGPIWNGPTMGEGLITAFTITATHEKPCPTNIPPCVLATASSNASPTNALPATLTTNGLTHIAELKVTKRYTNCGAVGIPDNFPINLSGTVTGVFGEERINFVNAGDLEKEGGGAWTINGSIEIPGIGTE